MGNSNPPKQAGTTPSTDHQKVRFYLRRELDRWDRVELDLNNGETADFMAIDFVLDKLTPVVEALLAQERNKAYEEGYQAGLLANPKVIKQLTYGVEEKE